MSLGLTDGKNQYGLATFGAPNVGNGINISYSNFSGKTLPYNTGAWGSGLPNSSAAGVSSDSTKSGLIASFSNISIGNLNSLKLGKYILKY